MTTSRGRALLLAARPRTLSAGIAPVTLGSAAAAADGYLVRLDLAALALAGALAIQVGTNYLNDAFDHERGADTPGRLGPRRAAASGLLTPGALKAAGAASFVVAAACGVPLIAAGGVPILVLGLLSLLFGWAYTGGPFPLAYHGLGELFVLAFFGLGAVGGTYWLHAHALAPAVLIAGLQNGLFACALLTVNNLRDAEGDAPAGKRTLVVRLGTRGGRMLLVLCATVPFALNGYWASRAAWPAVLASFVALIPTVRALMLVTREPPSVRYNRALAGVAAGHLLFAVLLAAGLILA